MSPTITPATFVTSQIGNPAFMASMAATGVTPLGDCMTAAWEVMSEPLDNGRQFAVGLSELSNRLAALGRGPSFFSDVGKRVLETDSPPNDEQVRGYFESARFNGDAAGNARKVIAELARDELDHRLRLFGGLVENKRAGIPAGRPVASHPLVHPGFSAGTIRYLVDAGVITPATAHDFGARICMQLDENIQMLDEANLTAWSRGDLYGSTLLAVSGGASALILGSAVLTGTFPLFTDPAAFTLFCLMTGGPFGIAWFVDIAKARRKTLPIRRALSLPRFPADAIAGLRHKQELLKAAYKAALVDGIAVEPESPAASAAGGAIDVAN